MNARYGFVLAAICASLLTACGGGGGGGSSPLPPGGQPSATPSSQPTGQPTAQPSGQPTSQPTGTPTGTPPPAQPTSTPTSAPTKSPTPAPSQSPTPVPTATPTVAPATVNVILGSGTTSAPVPSGAGYTGTLAIPAGAGTVAITGSSYSANTPVAIQVKPGSPVSRMDANTSVAYFTITAQNGPVTLSGLPGIALQLKPGMPSGYYFIAYYDSSTAYPAWVSTSSNGAIADANHIVTVAATTSPTISIPANSSITIGAYYGSYIPPINVGGCVGGNQQPLTKTRSLVGVHPITPGNAFSYAGTLNQTIVRTAPCPMPTATANAQVTVNASETAPPASAPAGTQTDEHSVEADAFSTYTQTVTTDSYVASNAGALYELGETATDRGGNTVTTTYGSPGLQFAQIPEANGTTWINAAPNSVISNLADGSRYTRTYSPSGNYSETDLLPGNVSSTITENADGSGTYMIGAYDSYGNPSQFPVTITAPSGNTITMTYNSTAHTVPLWYPLPFTPYSDVTQDTGLHAIDSACGTLPAGFNPAQAEKIVRTTTVVDAVVGYIDTRTTTTWDQNPSSPQGPLCVRISDVQSLYYDYMLDTNWLVYRTPDGNPIQTSTINETFSLANAPTATMVRRSTAGARAFRAQVAAGQAGISFARSVERAQRLASFAHALRAGRLGGRR